MCLAHGHCTVVTIFDNEITPLEWRLRKPEVKKAFITQKELKCVLKVLDKI